MERAPCRRPEVAENADLLLQPGEELLSGRAIVCEVEHLIELRLRREHERPQVGQIDTIRAVVRLALARKPAACEHVADDDALQTFFARVGGHAGCPATVRL